MFRQIWSAARILIVTKEYALLLKACNWFTESNIKPIKRMEKIRQRNHINKLPGGIHFNWQVFVNNLQIYLESRTMTNNTISASFFPFNNPFIHQTEKFTKIKPKMKKRFASIYTSTQETFNAVKCCIIQLQRFQLCLGESLGSNIHKGKLSHIKHEYIADTE